jgi:hypothetical protein
MIRTVLEKVYRNPDLLKRSSPLQQFLQTQGNASAQGTGNKVTEQEACFAQVLQDNGYVFVGKNDIPVDISYYKYQPNGTQRSPDFLVYDHISNKKLNFDLKHTTGKTFYLNDGWFEKDLIYVINWSPNREINKVLIGYGDDIPTDEENIEMTRFTQFKRECNKENKKVGSLRKYVRFANQYSCERFTEEFSQEKLNHVLESLTVQPSEYT